jgi:hypothetical protein
MHPEKTNKEQNNPETRGKDSGLLGSQWEEKLSQIAKNIKKDTRLTLMGSAPNMLRGQPSRMSIDLDVWKETSTFDNNDLKQAVEAADLLFNPTEEIPDKPYIQIVESGICQLGKFSKKEIQNIQKLGNLNLECPPIENLIASKLLRADPKDLEDINWMVNKYQPNIKKIKEIIKSFPNEHKEKALENLIYLDVICNGINHSPRTKKQDCKGKQMTQPSTSPLE